MVTPVAPPVLEVYYSPSCAPCRLELPAVAEFAQSDGARVRIVILDRMREARTELHHASPLLATDAVISGSKNEREALLAAGDGDGLLPYARVVASNGAMCAQWRGGLTLARARALLAACAARVISPRSHRS